MPTRILPQRPSLEYLRKQAKEHLQKLRLKNADASLAMAQHSLAKEYGYASWAKLKAQLGEKTYSGFDKSLQALRDGKAMILYDDAREDEGDFVFAAEKISPEAINFLSKFGRGTICLALAPDYVERLQLPLMQQIPDYDLAAFTLSIDAREGVSSGVSAADRAKTVLAAISADAGPHSIKVPGHIFPLRAAQGGLKERRGHTEASVALMQRAGLKPAAVICEILNDDGTMARLDDVKILAEKFQMPLNFISDLVTAN